MLVILSITSMYLFYLSFSWIKHMNWEFIFRFATALEIKIEVNPHNNVKHPY
jgi:hypothetical protein